MEIKKKEVEKLIELRKTNTFLNHFWNVFSRDMKAKGEINHNEIIVWRQNMWIMSFYPIFTFEFNAENNLIKITDKLNPIGKTLIGCTSLWFLYIIFPKNISKFSVIDNWQLITIIALFVFLFIWLSRKIYKMERNNQLEEIYEILDIEVGEKMPEKEWSIKNTLIRLFTYPFSIFVITISFWSLFENGIKNTFLTLFGIGICGMYLYSDVRMIIQNKKTEK